MAMPPVLVELKASSSDFMAKMGEARAETAKLSTQGASNLAKFAAVGKAALLGITVGAAAVAVESLKMAADFQSAMELIHTQAGASQAEVDRMSKAVLSLAGSTATAPDELAAGLYHLESSGLHGARALEALKTAAEGAKIGHADLESVTNALNAAIASGIPGVQNMEQAMGALNAVVGSGDMRMQDLADAMGTGVLATVKGFGLSLNDVGAALATFGDNNIRGADAATQLRMAVLFMAKPAKGAESALKSIGLTTKSLADDMAKGGLNKAITDLHDHLQAAGDTGAKAGQVLLDAFGHKAGTGLSILVSQYARFESKTKEVADGARGFGADWQATTKTLSFQMDQLKATAEALAVKIGTALIPKVEAVAKAVAVAVDWFRQHKDMAMALGAAIGGFLTAAIVAYIVQLTIATAKSIANFAKMIAAGVKWAVTQTVKFAEVAAAALASFASMIAEAAVWAAGMAVSAAIAMAPFLPIIAVVAAVGVAAYELYKHWDQVWGFIKTIIHDAWAWIQQHAAMIVGAIALLFPELALLIAAVHEVYEHWQQIWAAIKTATSAVVSALTTVFHTLAGPVMAIVTGGVNALRAAWTAAWNAIRAVVSAVWSALSPVFHAIVDGGLLLIRTDIAALQAVWASAWHGIQSVIEGVWAVIRPIFDGIRSAAEDVASAISKVTGAAGKVGGVLGGIGHVLGFAGGVTSFAGGVAMVGEQGPELVRLPAGADVVPNRQTQAMLGDNSGLIEEIRGLRADIQRLPAGYMLAQRIR